MIFEFLYEKFASRVRVIQKSEFDWSSGYSLDPDDDYDDNDDDDDYDDDDDKDDDDDRANVLKTKFRGGFNRLNQIFSVGTLIISMMIMLMMMLILNIMLLMFLVESGT